MFVVVLAAVVLAVVVLAAVVLAAVKLALSVGEPAELLAVLVLLFLNLNLTLGAKVSPVAGEICKVYNIFYMMVVVY